MSNGRLTQVIQSQQGTTRLGMKKGVRTEWHCLLWRNDLRFAAGEAFGTSLSTRDCEQVVRHGSAFDGTGFDSIGAVAHPVRVFLSESQQNQRIGRVGWRRWRDHGGQPGVGQELHGGGEAQMLRTRSMVLGGLQPWADCNFDWRMRLYARNPAHNS